MRAGDIDRLLGGRRLEDVLLEASAAEQKDYVDALWIDVIYQAHGTDCLRNQHPGGCRSSAGPDAAATPQ
jgi:hypothetical protein